MLSVLHTGQMRSKCMKKTSKDKFYGPKFPSYLILHDHQGSPWLAAYNNKNEQPFRTTPGRHVCEQSSKGRKGKKIHLISTPYRHISTA